jgi:hypothetical protein
MRDLPERVEVALPGDCNQAVSAGDITAKRSFVGHRPFISAGSPQIAIGLPITSGMGTVPIPGPSGAVIRPSMKKATPERRLLRASRVVHQHHANHQRSGPL